MRFMNLFDFLFYKLYESYDDYRKSILLMPTMHILSVLFLIKNFI